MSAPSAKILILSATSKTNYQLAQTLKNELDLMSEISTSLIKLEDHMLPLYYPAHESEQGIPTEAYYLAEAMKSAQALILVAPEYNGSIPPIVSNAIAWMSRTGKDWREAFNGKLALLASQSGGGGQKVVAAMRGQLEHLGSIVLPRSIIVNSGKAYDPGTSKIILKQLASMTQALAQA